jgi:hypothetical protein
MLPDGKSAFPKLLYLDQNKWIDLSRANSGHPHGQPFKDALAAVRAAVDSGKLIVPYSAVNITEIAADHDPQRRERLARFIVEESCNRTILPFMVVRPWEVRNALHRHLGKPEPIAIRLNVVRCGFSHALGVQARVRLRGDAGDQVAAAPEMADVLTQVDAILRDYAESTELAMDQILEEGNDTVATEAFDASEKAVLSHLEAVRARAKTDITSDQRWAMEILEHLRFSDVGRALEQALAEFGILPLEFIQSLGTPEVFKAFFSGISTLHVMLSLTVARDRDLVRRIDQNDARDLIALSVALPYCNVVVYEKYWTSMLKSLALDKEYGTKVITDARLLPGVLAEMGCI